MSEGEPDRTNVRRRCSAGGLTAGVLGLAAAGSPRRGSRMASAVAYRAGRRAHRKVRTHRSRSPRLPESTTCTGTGRCAPTPGIPAEAAERIRSGTARLGRPAAIRKPRPLTAAAGRPEIEGRRGTGPVGADDPRITAVEQADWIVYTWTTGAARGIRATAAMAAPAASRTEGPAQSGAGPGVDGHLRALGLPEVIRGVPPPGTAGQGAGGFGGAPGARSDPMTRSSGSASTIQPVRVRVASRSSGATDAPRARIRSNGPAEHGDQRGGSRGLRPGTRPRHPDRGL